MSDRSIRPLRQRMIEGMSVAPLAWYRRTLLPLQVSSTTLENSPSPCRTWPHWPLLSCASRLR